MFVDIIIIIIIIIITVDSTLRIFLYKSQYLNVYPGMFNLAFNTLRETVQ